MGGAFGIGAVGTAGQGVVKATLKRKSHPTIRRFEHGAASHALYRFSISSHDGSAASNSF
jgi:hypothetical protein